MVLYILRGIFLLLAAAVTALYLVPNQVGAGVRFSQFVLILLVAIAIAAVVISVDVVNKKKKLSALSGVFLGLITGLIAAFALSFVVDLVGVLTAPELEPPPQTYSDVQLDQMSEANRSKAVATETHYEELVRSRTAYLNLLQGVKVFLGLITCYVGMSMVLQTKDDFRFIIPYVEFAKQVRGNRPILLDTSVIIDGRILDLLDTKIFQGTLVVPKFVLDELQTIADSSDKLRRARGRRGLEILQKLQENPAVDIVIEEGEVEGAGVDQKLVTLSQRDQARVMTNDFNLNKIATLRGVDVINLNDLAKALRPVVLPGENMRVKVVKPGEGPGQGVGYLDDGTMVVVENARQLQGQEIDLTVTSMLQTSAGRMIFGRMSGTGDEPSNGGEPGRAESNAPAATIESSAARPMRGPGGRNPRRN